MSKYLIFTERNERIDDDGNKHVRTRKAAYRPEDILYVKENDRNPETTFIKVSSSGARSKEVMGDFETVLTLIHDAEKS